jgi:hypothetical protein
VTPLRRPGVQIHRLREAENRIGALFRLHFRLCMFAVLVSTVRQLSGRPDGTLRHLDLISIPKNSSAEWNLFHEKPLLKLAWGRGGMSLHSQEDWLIIGSGQAAS